MSFGLELWWIVEAEGEFLKSQFKTFSEFEFTALLKRELSTIL